MALSDFFACATFSPSLSLPLSLSLSLPRHFFLSPLGCSILIEPFLFEFGCYELFAFLIGAALTIDDALFAHNPKRGNKSCCAQNHKRMNRHSLQKKIKTEKMIMRFAKNLCPNFVNLASPTRDRANRFP